MICTRYWQTRFGSVVEIVTAPNEDGWATFHRFSDGALREWHLSEVRGLKLAEVVPALREDCPELFHDDGAFCRDLSEDENVTFTVQS